MIEKSVPSPKTLVKATSELQLDSDHFEEIYNKILEKVEPENKDNYVLEVSNEYYLEHFRNT